MANAAAKNRFDAKTRTELRIRRVHAHAPRESAKAEDFRHRGARDSQGASGARMFREFQVRGLSLR